jgi:hypothetical protein
MQSRQLESHYVAEYAASGLAWRIFGAEYQILYLWLAVGGSKKPPANNNKLVDSHVVQCPKMVGGTLEEVS